MNVRLGPRERTCSLVFARCGCITGRSANCPGLEITAQCAHPKTAGLRVVPVATGVPGGQLRSTAFAAGDLWLASGSGLYHSTNSGVCFARVGNVVSADAVGFGRAASDTTYPTLFISGNANNVIGIFRSTNAGKSWTRINDDHHQWGSNWNRRRGSTRLWTRLSRHQWSRHHLRRSRFRKRTAVTGEPERVIRALRRFNCP